MGGKKVSIKTVSILGEIYQHAYNRVFPTFLFFSHKLTQVYGEGIETLQIKHPSAKGKQQKNF
jgi:hypothetical protein